MIKKPLLAGNCDLSKLKYPVIVSPKLDGIRCLVVNGKCVSRTFKPIPNHHVRNSIEAVYGNYVGFIDGELIVEGKQFNEISSAIMSEDGEPDFRFVMFDMVENLAEPYSFRFDRLNVVSWNFEHMWQSVAPGFVVMSEADVLSYDTHFVDTLGYEGTMIRSMDGLYKQGRSTSKEAILTKLKRFEDSEAEILGYEEQQRNENEVTVNEAGKNVRSKKQENMVNKGTLGAVVVRDVKTGVEFNVSTGFTDTQRKDVWENQDKYLGKLIKYSYQKHGTVDKPRSPVFLGFRHKEDM